MVDYIARFGLEFDPFLKNSKEFLVGTSDYKETVIRLNTLSKTRGFGILTGSPGKGKTTILRNWAASLNPSLYKVFYSCLATLTVQEFYRNLVLELGAVPRHRKTDNFRIIQQEIRCLAYEKRKTPVFIIDEANYFTSAILNDLKILFNFEMDSKDPAIVILSGLPQLNNNLRLNVHEPLRQRITMNYSLDGMSKDESRNYIRSKLSHAGCHQQVFDDPAMEAIINSADGTPRIINTICTSSMLIASAHELNLVNTDSVAQAINENELG